MADTAISIIIPAYNQERRLRDAVEAVRDRSHTRDQSVEVIIVDDGCTDATPKIAAELAGVYADVRRIHRNERLGKGAAVSLGMDAANGDVVGFMDPDIATHPGVLDSLLNAIGEGADIAIGSRYTEGAAADRGPTRDLMSKGYNFMARTVLGTGVHDHQAGLKLLTRDAYETLRPRITADHWFWDTELLYRAHKADLTVEEVPVDWPAQDESTVNPVPVAVELLQGVARLKAETVAGSRSGTLVQYATFAVVGAIGAVLNTAALYILTDIAGLYYLFSAVAATELAIIAMFLLNNAYTFTETKETVFEHIDGLVRSNVVRSGGILVQLGLLYALTEFFGLFYLLSNIAAITAASVVNFFAEKHFNWGA